MRTTLLVVTALMASCSAPSSSEHRSFSGADEAAIRAVMEAQERAWDSGDIEGFMKGYADGVCFIGRKGLTCGRQAVTANYKESYPDPAAMGDLTFGVTDLRAAGADHAWLTGTWRLERAQDTLSGGFSLLWERAGQDWRILRDHSY